MAVNQNLKEVGRGLSRLTSFFGCDLKEVDPINLTIAINHDCPKWLRNRPLWKQTPRQLSSCTSNETDMRPINNRTIAEMVVWVVENTKGRWDSHTGRFYFEDDTDAVHFRLRWGLGSD